MLDPITAIGLAGNIVQFVDFSGKIVLTALKIYRSPSGTTQDGINVKLVADNIASLKNRIECGLVRPLKRSDDQLLELGKQCVETADELATVFRSRFGPHAKPGILIATKEALRLGWKREDIEKLKGRIASFREQLALHILVELRETIAAANLLQSEQYASLDAWTKEFAVAVAEQRNVFVDTMKAQLDELKDLHEVTQTSIVDEHGNTRNVFVAELKTYAEANAAEHQKTCVELRDSVVLEVTVLRKEMESLRINIQQLIEEAMRNPRRKSPYSNTFSRAPSRYYEISIGSKALNAAWYAKDIKLSELMTKITAHQVDEMTALLEGQILSTPAAGVSRSPGTTDRNDTNSSTRTLVLGSKVLSFGKTFKIDEILLREGGCKLGFRHDLASLPASLQIALSNRFSTQQISGREKDMRLAMNSVEPFFFAGSFLFPSILRLRINGASLQGIAASMMPATLRGYHAFVVRDAAWPALSPCGFDVDSTPGMLVFGLRDSQRQSLVDFQGGMFDIRFEVVEVEVAFGHLHVPVQLKAACFVWNGEPSELVPLAEAKWSPTRFMDTSFYERLQSIVYSEENALAERLLQSRAASHAEVEGNRDHQPPHTNPPPLSPWRSSIHNEKETKTRKLKRRRMEEEGEHSIYMASSTQPEEYEESYHCRGFPEMYPIQGYGEARVSDLARFESGTTA